MISEATWRRLVSAEREAVEAGWAEPGVFATAVGPEFQPGSPRSVLYVGKSGGPRIGSVGISADQTRSAKAAAGWMLHRRNPSAFWAFADQLVDSRASMAWSNVSRIDRRGKTPPSTAQWRQVREPCLAALREELDVLRPGLAAFVTGRFCSKDIAEVLKGAGYRACPGSPTEGVLVLFDHASGRSAAILRHPQGWTCSGRDEAARLLRFRPAA